MLKNPILHAPLDALAYVPILSIDQMPKIHRIGTIEIGIGDFCGVEQKVALDSGVTGALGPQIKSGYVIH